MDIILKKGQWCNKHGTPITEKEKAVFKSIIQDEIDKNLNNNQFTKFLQLFMVGLLNQGE